MGIYHVHQPIFIYKFISKPPMPEDVVRIFHRDRVHHRVHRVATAAFWRTFSDTFTLTSKVAVYAPAEWADTLTLFHL
jgi:hypothetical protein